MHECDAEGGGYKWAHPMALEAMAQLHNQTTNRTSWNIGSNTVSLVTLRKMGPCELGPEHGGPQEGLWFDAVPKKQPLGP